MSTHNTYIETRNLLRLYLIFYTTIILNNLTNCNVFNVPRVVKERYEQRQLFIQEWASTGTTGAAKLELR